jgi:pyruvate-ferredoxin/flavodoxin oxidoreductase
MIIGNATGCSSIWGGSAPSVPYCSNKNGYGPTWANSLFEDSAEFTYGMFLGVLQQRRQLAELARKALEAKDTPAEVKTALEGWLDHMQEPDASRTFGDQLKALLPKHSGNPLLTEIRRMEKLFTKKSFWVFLGDGAAYDIGFGGIDHVRPPARIST